MTHLLLQNNAPSAEPLWLDGIELDLIGEECASPLTFEQWDYAVEPVLAPVSDRGSGGRAAPGTRLLRSFYHAARPAPGVTVILRWNPRVPVSERRPRRVRLTIEGDGPHWDTRWPRWSHVRRRAPELAGGDAIGAQDELSEDGRALTLLLLPTEVSRTALLEFRVPLLPTSHVGEQVYRVRATEVLATEEDSASVGAPRSITVNARLRLFHPAPRILDYLPSVYREALDAESAALSASTATERAAGITGGNGETPFFSRYLRGFDDLLEPLGESIGLLYTLFGTETAPSEFVPWLAQWVGLSLDENWPELRRRRLIREAVTLFRQRGTRRGLSRYLEIYAGVAPRIDDQPIAGMVIGPDALLGTTAAILGHIEPHTFLVTLSVANPASVSTETIRAIIDAQKPAHTTYTLRILPVGTGSARPGVTATA